MGERARAVPPMGQRAQPSLSLLLGTHLIITTIIGRTEESKKRQWEEGTSISESNTSLTDLTAPSYSLVTQSDELHSTTITWGRGHAFVTSYAAASYLGSEDLV